MAARAAGVEEAGADIAWIDGILESDRSVHAKQRHTAQRTFEWLLAEEGYTGGYTIVREYVAAATLRRREMFVPLSHRPGHAQADLAKRMCISWARRCGSIIFAWICRTRIMALSKPTRPRWRRHFVRPCTAFAHFGGVPEPTVRQHEARGGQDREGGKRLRLWMFAELQSHYLFADRFGRPGKGNDKGKVEAGRLCPGYFMTPMPVAASFEALNAQLIDGCRKRRAAVLRGHSSTISARMQADLAAFMPLPASRYDASHKVATRVSSLSLVRYRNNDYSVPTRYGHQEVWPRVMSTVLRSPAVTRPSPFIPVAMRLQILSTTLCIT